MADIDPNTTEGILTSSDALLQHAAEISKYERLFKIEIEITHRSMESCPATDIVSLQSKVATLRKLKRAMCGPEAGEDISDEGPPEPSLY